MFTPVIYIKVKFNSIKNTKIYTALQVIFILFLNKKVPMPG